MLMAAENGMANMYSRLAAHMYIDFPHAREVGRVVDADRVAPPAGVNMEGHDVPPDVLSGVVHWLRKVGRCRLTISKPELKARLVSALETKM